MIILYYYTYKQERARRVSPSAQLTLWDGMKPRRCHSTALQPERSYSAAFQHDATNLPSYKARHVTGLH